MLLTGTRDPGTAALQRGIRSPGWSPAVRGRLTSSDAPGDAPDRRSRPTVRPDDVGVVPPSTGLSDPVQTRTVVCLLVPSQAVLARQRLEADGLDQLAQAPEIEGPDVPARTGSPSSPRGRRATA